MDLNFDQAWAWMLMDGCWLGLGHGVWNSSGHHCGELGTSRHEPWTSQGTHSINTSIAKYLSSSCCFFMKSSRFLAFSLSQILHVCIIFALLSRLSATFSPSCCFTIIAQSLRFVSLGCLFAQPLCAVMSCCFMYSHSITNLHACFHSASYYKQ
jgi:hypothetical protein